MRPNRKSRNTLSGRTSGGTRRGGGVASMRAVLTIVGLAILAAVAIAGFFGYNSLNSLWMEQCIITDAARQVKVITGSQVRPGVIIDGFGLTNGANLAKIDFKTLREELISRIPNIKTLTVERHMPDNVVITVGEREPVARMETKGVKAQSGRVVDDEGVVFIRRVGTGMMPAIREPHSPGTTPGKRLTGRALAALRLLAVCSEEEFSSFNILEVDISARDSIVAVLSSYQRVRIAWDGMDDPSEAVGAKALRRQLSELQCAMKSGIGSRALVWNATQPGRISADTKEPIP